MRETQLDPAPKPFRMTPLVAAAIVALVLAVYAPALDNGFVNWDDNVYVTGNPMVQRGLDATSLHWAATGTVNSSWNPVTMISHMVDVELFGLDPRGHHLTNIVLHALNAALLFVVLLRMTGHAGRSAAVAVLFAVHPARVESVAWIAERKDVLSTLFWLLAMLAYLAWRRQPSPRRYALTGGFLALGLMAKPMLVTLPCVLLLLDAWPLRRIAWPDWARPAAWWPLVREKLPFFAIVLLFCAITVAVQDDAIEQVEARPLVQRVANAANGYVWYLAQTAVPHDQAAFYPFHPPGTVRPILATLLLATISLVLFRRRRRVPFAAFGWLWFLGTLVPVIGLLPIGGQAWADRFSYVPSIGLLVAGTWGLHALLRRWRIGLKLLPVVATLAALAFAVVTREQIGYWHSSETLFRRALAVTEDNVVAHLNLAEALAMEADPGSREEALHHYRAALALEPEKAEMHAALGSALQRFGRPVDAQASLTTAVRLAPEDPRMHHALAMLMDDRGAPEAARDHLERAVEVDPRFAPAHHGLGAFHEARGNRERAIQHFRAALDADPDRDLHGRLGVLLGQQGSLAEAATLLREAVNRHPDDPAPRFNLGVTQAQMGDLKTAAQTLRAAAVLAPNDARIEAMLQRVESRDR